MKTTFKFVLMFCLFFSATFCHAHGMVGTKEITTKRGDTPILVIKSIVYGGLDKSSSIQATLDGHWLTVVFTENLGMVQINITDDHGNRVEMLQMFTPNGYSVYIYDTGSYVITFTLPKGDEYYGEFEVD